MQRYVIMHSFASHHAGGAGIGTIQDDKDKKGCPNMRQTPADIALEIIDEFSFFDDWADKYQHLIDQGRHLPELDDAYRQEAYILKGCQSVVYFAHDIDDEGRLIFHASSDAAIVQGLVALLLRVYSGQRPSDIMATDASFVGQIGLDKHLSATRKTGLASMVSAIHKAASDAINSA